MKTRILVLVALLGTLGCAKSFDQEFLDRMVAKGYTQQQAECALGYVLLTREVDVEVVDPGMSTEERNAADRLQIERAWRYRKACEVKE